MPRTSEKELGTESQLGKQACEETALPCGRGGVMTSMEAATVYKDNDANLKTHQTKTTPIKVLRVKDQHRKENVGQSFKYLCFFYHQLISQAFYQLID